MASMTMDVGRLASCRVDPESERSDFLARLSHDGWIFQAAAAMAGTPGRFPASKSV
jgi:hypothetical protein